ncbi:MAG: aldehyde dehydrogenase family protein [Lysobacterales bacterium]
MTINGDDALMDVPNPRTGEVDYQLEPYSAEQLGSVADSLRAAQMVWEAGGLEARCQAMRQWIVALKKRESAIVDALSLDTGRRAISRGEFGGTLGAIERWCGLAPELMATTSRPSRVMPHVELAEQLVPYPLLGVISPWNFPLTLSLIDAIPALLAGCAVMIKPSEVTPRFVEPLNNALAEVPELARVLAFTPGGAETGQALIEQVSAVAFTGSVVTGRKVAEAAARHFIPAFLELGGKDPAIVLEDADLERAATALLRGSVVATGQACQSIERIYVARSRYQEFVDLLAEKAGAVETTDQGMQSGHLGPFIFGPQAGKVLAQVEQAVKAGATVVSGGKSIRNGGAWLAPTILTGVDHDMAVMREETFGPVLPVMAFDSVEEALALANDSEYGLSGCVFGADETQCLAVARRLNVGGVSINDASMTSMIFEAEKNAFGESGLGASRMGPSGLTRFLRKKALYINRGEVMPIDAVRESE